MDTHDYYRSHHSLSISPLYWKSHIPCRFAKITIKKTNCLSVKRTYLFYQRWVPSYFSTMNLWSQGALYTEYFCAFYVLIQTLFSGLIWSWLLWLPWTLLSLALLSSAEVLCCRGLHDLGKMSVEVGYNNGIPCGYRRKSHMHIGTFKHGLWDEEIHSSISRLLLWRFLYFSWGIV